MVDIDTFKAIIHEDEAFKIYVEHNGIEDTRNNLQEMSMKLTTQIATYGNERADWFRKAKGLLAVVKNRQAQLKIIEESKLGEWKEFAGDVIEALTLNYGDNFEGDIDYEDLDSLKAFFASTGI